MEITYEWNVRWEQLQACGRRAGIVHWPQASPKLLLSGEKILLNTRY